jgi:putative aldouronate transport system permease protein
MGIDNTLFEAASLDGAGVFAKLRHITLPSLVPILVYQIIMSIGNILKGAGGEQILIFATSAVRENKALVIDTWLYWEGLQGIKYGLSAAISFAQAVIGFFMVIGAHKTSQKLVGIGAW